LQEKLYKGRKLISKVNMKKIKQQSKKSFTTTLADSFGCPACYLVVVRGEKYQKCKKCGHLFTGKSCEYCEVKNE